MGIRTGRPNRQGPQLATAGWGPWLKDPWILRAECEVAGPIGSARILRQLSLGNG